MAIHGIVVVALLISLKASHKKRKKEESKKLNGKEERGKKGKLFSGWFSHSKEVLAGVSEILIHNASSKGIFYSTIPLLNTQS